MHMPASLSAADDLSEIVSASATGGILERQLDNRCLEARHQESGVNPMGPGELNIGCRWWHFCSTLNSVSTEFERTDS